MSDEGSCSFIHVLIVWRIVFKFCELLQQFSRFIPSRCRHSRERVDALTEFLMCFVQGGILQAALEVIAQNERELQTAIAQGYTFFLQFVQGTEGDLFSARGQGSRMALSAP